VSSVGGNGFGTRTFWIVAIPDSAVTVHFGAGSAEMQVNNLAESDDTKIPISLGPNFQTASVPATVSFDVVWSRPITRTVTVTNGTNGDQFAGDYVENRVTVNWSVSEAGFTFTANSGNFSTSLPGDAFAELGHEGNGIFAPPDSDMGTAAPALLAALPQAASPLVQPVSSAVAPGETHLAPRPANGDGRHLTSGVAGNFRAKVGAVARTAPLSSASTALFTEVGQQGLDILFR
jgi:hypothetical protein